MDCKCSQFGETLKTFADVEKRLAFGNSMKKDLVKIADGNWRSVYRCETCGTFWVEEFPFSEQQAGGPSCFYKIETTDPEKWLKDSPYLTQILRGKNAYNKFHESLVEEEVGPEKCRKCDRLRIKHSVFCATHHIENLYAGNSK